MKTLTTHRPVLGALLALGLALTANAALVVVNTTESWDGVNNPHAADGVTLTGTGADGDPAIYTIPNGLTITSTGKINLWGSAATNNNINFVIQGGDLQIDAGGVLNPELYTLRSGIKTFVLDLSVTNSITGAGKIGERNSNDSIFRTLTIQNVKNVSLADIFMQVINGNRGPADFANIAITASGSVLVTGAVDNSDRDTGGDGNGDITIKANTIDVNNVDARGFRNDPPGRDPYSGNVTLQALSPVGGYSTTDAVNNASTNRLTVRGSILTFSVDPETIGGNVTLQSVVLQLVFGNINVPPAATKTLLVGKEQNGAAATDLYVDISSSGQTVSYDVDWGGTWTPPAGSPPVFTADPTVRADATSGVAYSQTLVGTATDADLDPLTFAKLSGPAWLTIAPNGALSGTPTPTDSCTNTWQISVSDGTRFDVATLQIFVQAPPRWNDGDNNFAYDNATQNVPYVNTLATNVIYCGAQTLTFAKTAGPAWLNVAANGDLSGTPDPTNVLNNVFTVTVSDGTTTVPATLNIFVNGSPTFPISPFPRATAFVSQGDYAIRNQTLAGAATDPQDPLNPNTLSWAKVSGPNWLSVAPDGSLSGTPTAGDIGINTFTVSAANAYPATTATLRIIVVDNPGTAPVEVVTREYWDGIANPHAADGVTLTGTGSESDPATYTVPRGLLIYGSGQIYTSLPTGQDSQEDGSALHIRFVIEGDLNIDAQNNAFVIGVHARNLSPGRRILILDLNGTNSIVGQGRIVGLGNRVNAATFPDSFDRDTPRVVTITNVNNVSLYDINVQTRSSNFSGAGNGRPLVIVANGKVQVTSGIDNSDRDGGGDSGGNVTVTAKTVTVNTVRSDSARTGSFRGVGNITLTALASPGFNPADGVNNDSNNWLRVTGNLRATSAAFSQNNTNWGLITATGVVFDLAAGATINGGANTNTLPSKLSFNVGLVKNGAVAGDLFRNSSISQTTSGAPTAINVVDWSGTIIPASPNIVIGPSAPGQIVLSWTGNGFVLQQNPVVNNSGGWVNAPSGTNNPATNAIGAGSLFYRLKWPQ